MTFTIRKRIEQQRREQAARQIIETAKAEFNIRWPTPERSIKRTLRLAREAVERSKCQHSKWILRELMNGCSTCRCSLESSCPDYMMTMISKLYH
jgi:hypothetical protein